MESLGVKATKTGLVPDKLVRAGIRILMEGRNQSLISMSCDERAAAKLAHVKSQKTSAIATHTNVANEQHYEVPTTVYDLCLGPHKKYSGCEFDTDNETLEDAEVRALTTICERAELEDGQSVLDMGCGWGSFSLFAAAKYPNGRFTAVSNSATQKAYIDEKAHERGITNLTVITAEINAWKNVVAQFDRVVTVEMLEHLKNYEKLLSRVASWLKPTGKLFVHMFTHATQPYHFDDGWMARTFFTGGQMPSSDLLLYFQSHLTIENQWAVNGHNYQLTSERWLENCDTHKIALIKILDDTYGQGEGYGKWIEWRLFFLACAECFGYNKGETWYVSHYLFNNSPGIE
ncbi:hypothetical protein TrLO_g14366 [Triparma laevis f. longispina]|uniref:Uncharacterized protein n=1 Tax=Triparma laevis f. longispina TaxID=1714387 RepID=A0A9W7FVM0_9STRA|nr:hypothetical protein TrLO_g14366 [Triparma laevis f. longispina]